MKKILFIVPYYKIGGTLTSFSNLIPLIDKSKYEVSAYALTNEVDDMTILPEGVNYIGLRASSSGDSQKGLKSKLINLLKQGKRLLTYIGYDPSEMVFKKMAKSLSCKYDVVIAFQEGHATRMAQHILAPMKIAWIHSIYSRFKNMVSSNVADAYEQFDKVVCVSHTAAKDMIECKPQWENKIQVVYNAVNSTLINDKSKRKEAFEKKINIVSVGRIAPVKRFSCIPAIANQLKQLGYEFDWRIIGGVADSEEYTKLLDNIKVNNVSDCVHLLGSMSNPYPCIKSSDMLVCLSSSETFNYTIAESKVLGIPVVSTDFSCAFEFLENEKSGLILPIEEIADGIHRLLSDNKLYSNIKKHLADCMKSSTIVKEQFEQLLEK